MSTRRILLRLSLTGNHRRLHTHNGAMNGEYGQRNGTALCLLKNPASSCSITMVGFEFGDASPFCVMHHHSGPAPGFIVHCHNPLVRIAGTLNKQLYMSELLLPSSFRRSKKKKSKGLRFGECGGQTTSPPRPIHLRRYIAWRWLRTGIEKCADALLCMNHTFWCVVACTSCSNSSRSWKFAYVPVSSTLPRHFKSPPSFGHYPGLVHRPPHGYNYRDFYRLNLAYDLWPR
ncbi:hypothetical protein TNCV_1375751 [Trichonephila clavipes]|nr:hypothetical protein TNCV_1375751 [Trichonephila clavipes]